jgi:hypothetical protein
MKAIKSKKWYQNQIKCLENATNQLGNSISRMMEICHNDIGEGFEQTRSDRKTLANMYSNLGNLKEEYYMYYRS